MASYKNLLILLAVLALAALAALSVSPSFKVNVPEEISLKPQKSWVGQYLSGYHAAQQRDYSKASEFFSDSLSSRTNSQVLQSQAMNLLIVSGKFSQAIVIAKDLYAKNGNGLAKLALISDLIKNNKLAEAKTLALQTSKGDSTTIINQVILAWIEYGLKDKEEAERILKLLQKDQAFLPFVNYNYALISELSGNTAKASELYDSLLASPQLPNSIVSAAYGFYDRQKNEEKKQLIEKRFGEEAASKNHPRIETVSEGVAEALLGIGSIIMTEYSPDKSAALFRLSLYLNPDLDDAKLLLGSVLMNEGDYNGANEILSQISRDSYLGDYAKLAIAKNFEALGEDTKAKRYFQKLTESDQVKLDAYVSLGDLARKNEKFSDAADFYSQAIEAAKSKAKNGELDKRYWALYFARGVCYERMKEWQKSEADLTTALKMEPNQPDVMNYLGYSWIDMGKNLDKAKEMVILAHKEKPDDPQIVDSVGWAYFKLGSYEKSVEYLEAAITLLPYDPVVNDHLGDAYWQTGRKNEARFQWNRALKNNPEPKLADELKEKLEKGILKVADNGNDNKSAR